MDENALAELVREGIEGWELTPRLRDLRATAAPVLSRPRWAWVLLALLVVAVALFALAAAAAGVGHAADRHPLVESSAPLRDVTSAASPTGLTQSPVALPAAGTSPVGPPRRLSPGQSGRLQPPAPGRATDPQPTPPATPASRPSKASEPMPTATQSPAPTPTPTHCLLVCL